MTIFLTISMIAVVNLVFPGPATVTAQDHSEPTLVSTDDGSAWRRTRFGWEDSRYWEPVSDHRPEPMPGMHPLVWSGLLTLSVLVMVIWASEEDEVAGLAPSLNRAPVRRPESAKAAATERGD